MWLFTSSSICAAEETALARDLGPTTSSVAASKLFFNVQEPTPGSDPTTCSLSSRYRMRSIVDKIYYMGAAEAEVVVQKNIPANIHMPSISQCEEVNSGEKAFVPSIRSGGFADIGPRRYMEDEHIRIDDLSESILTTFPHQPTAFYGVFDGHGGPEAAAYLRKNAIRFFFEDANLPRACGVINDAFLAEVESCLRKGYLLADMALADETSVSSSSGTTALTALVIGKLLMVANVGDCRAVLSRKGQAIDMSQDHRPNHEPERKRVEEVGGFIDDGYLNGVLSITRALGDWDLKLPPGNSSSSPLIAEPEFRRITLTDDDEFLIIGCDGVWDVMSSQQAVSLVRRGLRRHDDPEQCAKDVVMEALRMNTFDNLTVIVVCFGSLDQIEQSSDVRQKRLRCCSLSPEALCSLRSLLEGRK